MFYTSDRIRFSDLIQGLTLDIPFIMRDLQRNLFSTVALLIALFSIHFTFASDEAARKLIESDIEKFHLNDATSKLYQLSAPYRTFYESNILIYKWAASQDNAHVVQFFKNWDATMLMIETMPKTNPHRRIFMAEMNGKRATLEFVKGDYVKSVMHAKECYNLIQENVKLFPNDISNYKMQGLFNIALSSVPKKYQWIINSLGFKGDVNLGMKQLATASAKGEVLRAESSYIAYYAEKNLMSKPEAAVQRLLNEQKISGSNIGTDFFIATGYFVMNKNDKAFEILSQRYKYAQDNKVFYIPYWDYALAKSYYFKEDYKSAQTYFTLFLAKQKGTMYRTDGLFRFGMSQILSGDYATGKQQFVKLVALKRSGFDEDEYAYQMANRFIKSEPNQTLKSLFRARNLFDGGYFTKSLTILENLKANQNALTVDEKTELFYRFGRIYHAQKNYALAKTYYTNCTVQSQSSALYMQVYAHYYLGEMARALGKTEEARTNYKKALTFDGYAYQNGLESRCKTALGML